MALTPEQREKRQNSVGGSDVPAILGISPFKSASDIYLAKTVGVNQSSSPAIEAGDRLESTVVSWAMDRLKINDMKWSSANVRRTKNLNCTKGGSVPAHANLDFMFIAPEIGRCGLEAKTTSLGSHWGAEGTDEVPEHVLLQCLWQAEVADLNMIYVAVLIADRGFHFKVYEIDPEQYKEEREEMINGVGYFWNNYVMEERAPDETLPTIETLKKVIRTPNKTTQLQENAVKQWLDAKENLERAKKEEAETRKTVLNSMEDAEEGQSSLGTLTYYEYERKGYEVSPTKYRQIKWRRKEPHERSSD
jgi:predicted phage-related endonuclease